MKHGRSLQDVASELTRQRDTRKDYLASTAALTMTDTLELGGLNGDALPVRDTAHGQIAEEVGIPGPYYRRMRAEAPGLLATNVNHWFHAAPARRMVRTLDHGVRALLSERFRPLDNFDLAEVVLPTLLETGAEVKSTELTERRFYIKATLPALRREVQGGRHVGEIVEAGLAVSNSEIGDGSLRVEPLIMVLRCTNGLIAPDASMRRYHVGRGNGNGDDGVREFLSTEARRAEDRALWLKVRDVVRGAFSSDVFPKLVGRISAATADVIASDNLPAVVEVARERFGWSAELGGSILKHLAADGELSRWGLVQAITRASQDVEDYDAATELERLGGAVLELPATDWRRISEAVPA